MRPLARLAALAMCAAFASASFASAASAQNPPAPPVRAKPPWGALTDSVGAAEIVLGQVCLPGILEQRPITDLAYIQWLVSVPPKAAGAAASDKAWRLASVSPVYAIAWSDGSCSTFVDRGPADRLRVMADRVIRARPEQFTLASTTALDGGAVERSVYCGGAGGARYAATITTPVGRAPAGTRALASTVYQASAGGLCATERAPLRVSAAPAPTPGLQLVPPTGVGGCIFRKLPESVNRDALMAVMSHSDVVRVLREPVAAVAPQCTGRPYSASDAALVGAAISLYPRMVAASFLGTQLKIPQRQLDSAWTAATPDERAPYLASARSFLSPGGKFVPAAPGAVAPFQHRLDLTRDGLDPRVPQVLHMYYSASALSELSEAELAARGAAPPGGR